MWVKMKKRVVITGMEVTSSIGTGLNKFWKNACGGISGIDRIQSYDPSPYPTQIAGEVKDFNLDDLPPEFNKPKRYSKATQYALYCAHNALKQSGLSQTELANAGTFIGTGLGGYNETVDRQLRVFDDNWKKIPALTITKAMPNATANMLAIAFKLGGPNVTISNACISSAEAVGRAYEKIQWGKCPVAICGGTESMVWESIMATWCKLRVMSTSNDIPQKACRPFDSERDGMVMADGAAILVLEDLEHAKARGANILAEIIGFGSSCDAHHITAPNIEGQARAINQALDEAKTSVNDIQYINAHGTATKLNDITETQTIKKIFGTRAYDIPITAQKSMTGHSIGAAGALEIITTVQSLNHEILPPTINLESQDPECDLDYVPNKARKKKVDIALSNHFAFGGANAAIVLKKYC